MNQELIKESRNRALFLSGLMWLSPIAILLLKLPIIVSIFAICYAFVLAVVAIGSCERYLVKAKALNSNRNIVFAWSLLFLNVSPFVMPVIFGGISSVFN